MGSNANLPAIKSFGKSEAMMAKIEKITNNSEVFLNSVLTLCSNNDYLAKCTPQSIWGAAIASGLMGLSLSPSIAHGYIVPYGKEAKFMPSYKGLKQLALDTGKYKYIRETPIYADEFEGYDISTGEYIFNNSLGTDCDRFNGKDPIGYYSVFELKDGVRSSVFMTKKQVLDYAKKYSQAYQRDIQYKKKNSPWSKEFDAMALKTVFKQNVPKNGPINQKLEMALEAESSADAYENAMNKNTEDIKGQHIGTQEAEQVQEVPQETMFNQPTSQPTPEEMQEMQGGQSQPADDFDELYS